VKRKPIVKCFKKCGISNAFDGNEDEVLFKKSKITDSNSSHLSDSSDEDFKGFYDQQEFCTALPYCCKCTCKF
jgi:hypothetical protein